MVSPKKQEFWPRINILKGNYFYFIFVDVLQWNLDLRKPDLRKNLDLRKIF